MYLLQVDPTSLVAAGTTLPRVMGFGAGFGSSYSVLEDMATTGEDIYEGRLIKFPE